jgi:ribose 5-phosphate isomerase B
MTTYKIAIGSDHAGYELKNNLIIWLKNAGHHLDDFGANSKESCDYPDYIHPVACSVETNQSDFGIIICGSGNGAAITANKHPKIRAALCWNQELSVLAKAHNDANIIALPARFINEQEAKDIITAYLQTSFEGDRHMRRIDKINQADCK